MLLHRQYPDHEDSYLSLIMTAAHTSFKDGLHANTGCQVQCSGAEGAAASQQPCKPPALQMSLRRPRACAFWARAARRAPAQHRRLTRPQRRPPPLALRCPTAARRPPLLHHLHAGAACIALCSTDGAQNRREFIASSSARPARMACGCPCSATAMQTSPSLLIRLPLPAAHRLQRHGT